jgi:hypothetical protein
MTQTLYAHMNKKKRKAKEKTWGQSKSKKRDFKEQKRRL